MTSSDLRFGIKDCFLVVGLMLFVVGLIALLFEFLAWLQSGVWNSLSAGTVMNYFGVLPVHSTKDADALQQMLDSATQIVSDLPVGITMFLIGSVIAMVADHYIYASLQTIDRRYAPSLRGEFDEGGRNE
jgi:hypothetical protein